MALPRGVPDEVGTAISALRRACEASAAALKVLDASSFRAPEWSGTAAAAFGERKVQLSRRCAELEQVTASVGSALQQWQPQASADRAAMVRAAAALREVQAREQVAQAAGQGYTPQLTAAADAAWRDCSGARDRYWAAVARLTQALHASREGITDRPLSAGEHVQAFVSRVWQDGVKGPASQLWALTGAAVVDPAAWRETVGSLPGETIGAIASVVRHPVAAAAAAVDAPAWQQGRIGEGAGAVAAILMPTPRWLHLGPERAVTRVERQTLDPHAPLPSLQTVDELLAAPNLLRQEHATLGHTVSRHVAVDDDFLMDRLTHGTVDEMTGERTFAPREASRFLGQDVAEGAIGEALRANEALVRAFAGSTGDQLNIRYDTGRDIAVVMTPAQGGFLRDTTSQVAVQLRRDPTGRVFVGTAYAPPTGR